MAAVSNGGGLGTLTALTQPSPQKLREAIRETRALLKPEVKNRGKFGPFAVNLTLLPSINPPDYEGYTRAALEEGVRIFETAGNNRESSWSMEMCCWRKIMRFLRQRALGYGEERAHYQVFLSSS